MDDQTTRGDTMGEIFGAEASDLARRIVERRQALGLSAAEVARRAGLETGYLAYVEQNPGAVVGVNTLSRLAEALDTNRWALVGGDARRPPGWGRAGPNPILEELGRAQCEALLRKGGVGRVIFVSGRGPVAQPVNFGFVDSAVVFRTSSNASITGVFGAKVSFEVDQIDEATSEGWSVLVTGPAEQVEARDRPMLINLGIEPWAGGYRDVFVRIRAEQVSGRSIRQDR
jgi:hypothetical protein